MFNVKSLFRNLKCKQHTFLRRCVLTPEFCMGRICPLQLIRIPRTEPNRVVLVHFQEYKYCNYSVGPCERVSTLYTTTSGQCRRSPSLRQSRTHSEVGASCMSFQGTHSSLSTLLTIWTLQGVIQGVHTSITMVSNMNSEECFSGRLTLTALARFIHTCLELECCEV